MYCCKQRKTNADYFESIIREGSSRLKPVEKGQDEAMKTPSYVRFLYKLQDELRYVNILP